MEKTPDELRQYAYDAAHSPAWGSSPPLWYTALTEADWRIEADLLEEELADRSK